MTAVVLGKADIALWSDPGATRVVIPHLGGAARNLGTSGAVVQFEGDDYPTPFRGTSRSATYDLTCRYGAHEHDQLLALVRLLDEVAPAAPDSRLMLRTHVGQVAGLDPVVAVVVFAVPPVPARGLVVDLQFQATVVQSTVSA